MGVALWEVKGRSELDALACLVRTDQRGAEEFGGFYGEAVDRLGPLLGPARRSWLVMVAGIPVGFIDADLDGDCVGLSWFVEEAHRHQGIARTALSLVDALHPWPAAQFYLALVGRDNVASRRLAIAAGFHLERRTAEGDEIWRRAPRTPPAGL